MDTTVTWWRKQPVDIQNGGRYNCDRRTGHIGVGLLFDLDNHRIKIIDIVYRVNNKMGGRQFSVADYVIFGTNLVLCGAIGVFYAVTTRGQSTTSQFLMADHKLHVIPLTISLIVSVVSAVTLLGLPAEMYSYGSQYFFNIGSGLGIILTMLIFVPLLHPLKLTSMFEVSYWYEKNIF